MGGKGKSQNVLSRYTVATAVWRDQCGGATGGKEFPCPSVQVLQVTSLGMGLSSVIAGSGMYVFF